MANINKLGYMYKIEQNLTSNQITYSDITYSISIVIEITKRHYACLAFVNDTETFGQDFVKLDMLQFILFSLSSLHYPGVWE